MFFFTQANANYITSNEKSNVIGHKNTVDHSPNSNVVGDNNRLYDVSDSNNSLSSDSASVTGNSNTIAAGNNLSVFGNNNSINGDTDDSGGVIIGNKSIMKNAKNGIGIGTGTTVIGENSIAIGAGSSATEGSLALGYSSIADRKNTISMGNAKNKRQLTNVAEGAADSDAVNVKQLNQKAQEMLANANNYTNRKITDAKNELNSNITTAKNEAISSSNIYTDKKQEESFNYAKEVTNKAVENAIEYTKQREKFINSRADRLINNEEGLRIKGDKETLDNSNRYTENKMQETLTSANEYTDSSISKERKERQAENNFMQDKTKRYSNNLFEIEKKERIKNDQDTINNANRYTDFKIQENNELISADIATTRELLKNSNSVLNKQIERTKRNTDENLNRTQRDLSDNILKTQEESINFAKKLVNVEQKERNKENKRLQNYFTQYTDKNINNLSTAINRKLDDFRYHTHQKLNQINTKINRLENHVNAGIAGVTAIASIPYINSEIFSLGVGIGNYQNGKAVAVGAQYKIANNASVRLNISWDNTDNTGIGTGVAIGW